MKHKAFLGIDVSKGYADFILLNEQKEVIEAGFQLQDNSVGRQQLKDLIGQWFCKGIEQLCCGVESTGGYENNWYSLLKGLSAKMNIHVVRLNAKGVKAASDASLKRTITDAVSAHNIACYLISFPEKIIYMHGELQGIDLFTEGRQHNSLYPDVAKAKGATKQSTRKAIVSALCRNIDLLSSWSAQVVVAYARSLLLCCSGGKSRSDEAFRD